MGWRVGNLPCQTTWMVPSSPFLSCDHRCQMVPRHVTGSEILTPFRLGLAFSPSSPWSEFFFPIRCPACLGSLSSYDSFSLVVCFSGAYRRCSFRLYHSCTVPLVSFPPSPCLCRRVSVFVFVLHSIGIAYTIIPHAQTFF